jgi:SPP1 family predicted phage head-tail adaptor
MMRAGKLSELVDILAATLVVDDVGDQQETWAPVTTVWAEVVEMGAEEQMRAPQIRGVLDAIFRIRMPAIDVDSRMRLQREDGRLYEITGITALTGRRVGLEIQARSLDQTGGTPA